MIPYDLPPNPPARFLSPYYVDSYVDGQFCTSSYEIEGVWRTDVGCEGKVVEFRNLSGEVVAILPLENWHLTLIRE